MFISFVKFETTFTLATRTNKPTTKNKKTTTTTTNKQKKNPHQKPKTNNNNNNKTCRRVPVMTEKVPFTVRSELGTVRDGFAQTNLRAATLRQNLQIKLPISPSHCILTPGQPVQR